MSSEQQRGEDLASTPSRGENDFEAPSVQDLTSVDKLVERITDPEGRPLIFLLGSALTMPGDGALGVPGVEGVVAELERVLDGKGGSVFHSAVRAADYGAAYRAGFDRLLDIRGADAVNQVIRSVVLEAHRPLDEARRGRALARHVDEHRSECKALLEAVDGWHQLRPSVFALGEILTKHSDRCSRVLTTNFDPLVEIATKRAGGTARRTVLARDGSPGQHEGPGVHVVHLHGYWFGTDTLHTDVQLGKPRPKLEATLRRWLHDSLLVVLGYGGWDDVLMRSLRAVVEDDNTYPEVAWGFYGRRDAEVVEKLDAADHRVRFYEDIDLHKLLPRVRDRLNEQSCLDSPPSRAVSVPEHRVERRPSLTVSGALARERSEAVNDAPVRGGDHLHESSVESLGAPEKRSALPSGGLGTSENPVRQRAPALGGALGGLRGPLVGAALALAFAALIWSLLGRWGDDDASAPAPGVVAMGADRHTQEHAAPEPSLEVAEGSGTAEEEPGSGRSGPAGQGEGAAMSDPPPSASPRPFEAALPKVHSAPNVKRRKKPRATKGAGVLPSDQELKRRLAAKIKSECAELLEGGQVTVSFLVTTTGEVTASTAIPKDAAGACAKQQVAGARFRARRAEGDVIQIVVG